MSDFDLGHYRVEQSQNGDGACPTCGHGKHWTVVSGTGEDACEIGQSFGDRGLTEDICDLMNMAFDAGQESLPTSALQRAHAVLATIVNAGLTFDGGAGGNFMGEIRAAESEARDALTPLQRSGGENG